MKNYWWKLAGVILVVYAIVQGLLGPVPAMPILNETIRNLYFHVPMWFAMTALLLTAVVFGVMHLATGKLSHDRWAEGFTKAGVVMGFLGLFTGMMWARFTWGDFWVKEDPKLNGAAAGLLLYIVFLLLRKYIKDDLVRGKVTNVYAIFAFVMFMVFINIWPRMMDSLHPGNGGNPAFSQYDLDDNMRTVFYPAVLGWIAIGVWIAQVRTRIQGVKQRIEQLSWNE